MEYQFLQLVPTKQNVCQEIQLNLMQKVLYRFLRGQPSYIMNFSLSSKESIFFSFQELYYQIPPNEYYSQSYLIQLPLINEYFSFINFSSCNNQEITRCNIQLIPYFHMDRISIFPWYPPIINSHNQQTNL